MDAAEALHAAIDNHPDQGANYLVLADQLQQQGDPRGEVIAMWSNSDKQTKTERLSRARALGPPDPRHGAVDWFYGYAAATPSRSEVTGASRSEDAETTTSKERCANDSTRPHQTGDNHAEPVGHYDLTCSGGDEGWLEISADLTVTRDPSRQVHLTEQHVTAAGDKYQIDVTTHQPLGEGGYTEQRTQLKLGHDGGMGTIISSGIGHPTPTVSGASLLATRRASP